MCKQECFSKLKWILERDCHSQGRSLVYTIQLLKDSVSRAKIHLQCNIFFPQKLVRVYAKPTERQLYIRQSQFMFSSAFYPRTIFHRKNLQWHIAETAFHRGYAICTIYIRGCRTHTRTHAPLNCVTCRPNTEAYDTQYSQQRTM